LYQSSVIYSLRKHFFSNRVMSLLNSLPDGVVDSGVCQMCFFPVDPNSDSSAQHLADPVPENRIYKPETENRKSKLEIGNCVY